MVEKDIEKAQRLNEVYKHAFAHLDIKSQKDFADRLGIQRTGLSAAMNGSVANLTKNLFMKICATFPGVFNLDYLLTGKGSLLADTEEKQTTPTVEQPNADLLELYAQRIRLVDDLRASLKEELAEVQAIRNELQQARDDFRDATYRLTRTLAMFTVPTDSPVGLAAESIT